MATQYFQIPNGDSSASIASLASIDSKLTAPIPVEPLGIPAVARQQAVTVSNADVTLTATCKRVSLYARTCNMRYAVGNVAQTANNATSHFLAAWERVDISVPLNAHIAFIRDTGATVDGQVEITELT
jgi:hypothetical protein